MPMPRHWDRKGRIAQSAEAQFQGLLHNDANSQQLLAARDAVQIVLSMNAYYMIGQASRSRL